MPFIYASHSKGGAAALENMTASGTPNTEIDFFGMKPGASRPFAMTKLTVQGKGAGLTALSGISIRAKHWTSTAAAGGQALTPQPKHNLAPACVATAVIATTAGGAVTSGTGGPNIVGYAGMGASGPGGTVAVNPDDVPTLDGNANKSLDLFSSCPTASLGFEWEMDTQEG